MFGITAALYETVNYRLRRYPFAVRARNDGALEWRTRDTRLVLN